MDIFFSQLSYKCHLDEVICPQLDSRVAQAQAEGQAEAQPKVQAQAYMGTWLMRNISPP